MNNKTTLPFSAKKRCIIKMGPKQVSVSHACLLPHTTVERVVTIKDIVNCLNAGAKVTEIRGLNNRHILDMSNYADVENQEHAEYLRKFNADLVSPVVQRESYLIETPIPPTKVITEIKIEVPETPNFIPGTEPEPVVEEPIVEPEPVVEEPVVEEVIEENNETPVEEEVVEETSEPEEEVEETVESTEEESSESENEEENHNNNYYNNKKKNRRH